MRIEGRKLGIRTGSTIRKNAFDSDFCKKDHAYITDTPTETNKFAFKLSTSINKHKIWEHIDDLYVVKEHDIELNPKSTKITANTDLIPWGYGGGRPYMTCYTGRNVKVNPDIDESYVLHTPFKPTEYPMYREYHKKKDAPCPCCFVSSGRMWQLKGLGNKSHPKTKGMQKIHDKQMFDEYDDANSDDEYFDE
jgi:hypothetical protein